MGLLEHVDTFIDEYPFPVSWSMFTKTVRGSSGIKESSSVAGIT